MKGCIHTRRIDRLWNQKWLALAVVSGLLVPVIKARAMRTDHDPLKYFFDGKRGQVEVGGPYVGIEFHQSRPVPSRISFFYPVANSIDLSKDYWKRGESIPMVIGLRVRNEPPEWIQEESWSYVMSPHAVTFLKSTDSVAWKVSYNFCKNQPAAVVSLTLRNLLHNPLAVEVYTHLVLSLRTCQTYTRRDTALVVYDPANLSVVAQFNHVDTDSAAIYVKNVGESPAEWTSDASEVMATDDGRTRWPDGGLSLSNRISALPKLRPGIAAFVYRKLLGPGDSLNIVQILGSCKAEEVANRIAVLSQDWGRDIQDYDDFIRTKSEETAVFSTGDTILDRSAIWARGLIAANAHYLDGQIVPMPCPAEYNFFFTHDLLLTNLGAVNFDLDRVKSNLLYVVGMAKDSVIPHAYYWRDDGYKTEYCEPENWNHLWFILVSGTYLRHSLDDSTGNLLYPFLTKSIQALLTRLRSDNLMYAYRPDWWDIGHIEGPRSYLTALTVRALREFLFISSFLHKHDDNLLRYERTAATMQRALVDKLWDPTKQYLMNDNDGREDQHLYVGSLIATVYGLLDQRHARRLVTTATKQLVDERIGIRMAMPPDFSREEVIKKFKLAGKEAGPPYSYINGGVWPHGNAWYAMSLNDVGRQDEAYEFIKRTMTVDGVAISPNGAPAMYEYRSSDPSSPSFGTIDKPSFLWAGGMYFQVLYRLMAVDENEWNIGIRDALPAQCDSVACTLTFGGRCQLLIHRSSDPPGILKADGQLIASRILPLDLRSTHLWESSGGRRSGPVLKAVNAIVYAVEYDRVRNQLSFDVSSFDGHTTELKFVSEQLPKRFTVDGRREHKNSTVPEDKRLYLTTIVFSGSSKMQHVTVMF